MPKVDRPARPTVDSSLANRAFARQQYLQQDGSYSPSAWERDRREYHDRHIASASPGMGYRKTASRSRSPPGNRFAARRDMYDEVASPTTPNDLYARGPAPHVRLAPFSAGLLTGRLSQLCENGADEWNNRCAASGAQTPTTATGPTSPTKPILRLPPPGALCPTGQSRVAFATRDLKVSTHELAPPTPTLPRMAPNTPCTPTRPFPGRLLRMERDNMYSTGDFYLASSDNVLFVVQRHDLYAASEDFHGASEKTQFERDGQMETARFIHFWHRADTAITLRMFLGLKHHGKLPDMHEETPVVVERVQHLFRFLRDWNCVVPMRLAKFCLEEMAKNGGINPLSALILASQLNFPDLFTIALSRSARLMRPDVPGDDIYLGQPKMSILDPRGMSFTNWTQITPTYQWALVRAFHAAHPNPELSPDGSDIVAHFNHFHQLATGACQEISSIRKTIAEPFSIKKREPRVRPYPQPPYPAHQALRQPPIRNAQPTYGQQHGPYPHSSLRTAPTSMQGRHTEFERQSVSPPVHPFQEQQSEEPNYQQNRQTQSHIRHERAEREHSQDTERASQATKPSQSRQSCDEPRPETESPSENPEKELSAMDMSL